MLKHCTTERLESERLILRRFEYTDDEHMLANWISDSAAQALISEPVYTTKNEVKELLDSWIGSYSNSDYYRWAIVERSTNICIGQIAIWLVDNKNNFGEFEYILGSEFRRNGYTTEAVRMVLDLAFNRVGFHKMQVCHKDGNIASQGVIKKCGFTYEGTLRDYFYIDGRYVNRLYYSMLKDEFR